MSKEFDYTTFQKSIVPIILSNKCSNGQKISTINQYLKKYNIWDNEEYEEHEILKILKCYFLIDSGKETQETKEVIEKTANKLNGERGFRIKKQEQLENIFENNNNLNKNYVSNIIKLVVSKSTNKPDDSPAPTVIISESDDEDRELTLEDNSDKNLLYKRSNNFIV